MRIDIKAYRQAEGIVRLSLDAADLVGAQRQAESQGYLVLGAETARTAGFLSRLFSFSRRFSVSLFCQELLALMEAGMGLVESLDILHRKARQEEVKTILGELHRLVGEGRTFSRALEGIPDAFPALVIASVRASEHTGDLPEALRRYLDYQKRVNVIRDKVVAASVYPILLLLVGTLVVLFLMLYVVPRFARIYEDVGRGNLPFLSQLLMRWGQLAGDHVGAVIAGFGVLLGMAIFVVTRPSWQAKLTQRLWRLPGLGEYFKIYQLARFTRTVAMLLKGGTPFVTALDMAGDLLRQPGLKAGLDAARREIREGHSVSDTFGRHGLATEVGTRLLVVGERSGELGEVMERIASFYDDEIARAVEWFSRLFEPLLMIFIGLIVGGVVILMYLPIFELASSIQ